MRYNQYSHPLQISLHKTLSLFLCVLLLSTHSFALSMHSKKIINSPETCVEDCIQGSMLCNSNLIRVGTMNVLLRSDITEYKKSYVTILSGGGSGHEPAHTGFVGPGMLSGAILGNVFASPPVAAILAAIRVSAGPAGVLLVVKNYTGDRLNFGMALELARQEGIKVEMVVVADDLALPLGKGITGGRGIAGTVFVHKIAGAKASQGASLEEVVAAAKKAANCVGSLGIALSTCTVPGTPVSTRLQSEDGTALMEVGMGIHGEPGREKRGFPSSGAATEIARTLVEGVLGPVSPQKTEKDPNTDLPTLSVTKGQKVAVLLNNLGTLPPLELHCVAKDVMTGLISRGLNPVRAFVGPFMTALEMNGVSLSLLTLDEDILSLLDVPTEAPAWVKSSVLDAASSDVITGSRVLKYASSGAEGVKALTGLVRCDEKVFMIAKEICRRVIQLEPLLTEYDAICGDGDCGVVMKKGATQVFETLDGQEKGLFAAELCNRVADSISASMGGTSGALLELCFRAMAGHFTTSDDDKVGDNWVLALEKGVLAISKYGGATAGMRTMLDAFVPAVEALKQGKGVQAAAESASNGAESTKTMGSLAGRANYVSADKLNGVPDPGAVAVATAFVVVAEMFE